jgi:hypothetical protein
MKADADMVTKAYELDLGDNGGLVSFNTVEEIDHWLDRERKALAWAIDAAHKNDVHAKVAGTLRSLFKQVARQLNEARPKPDGLVTSWPLVSGAIKEAFGPIPHSLGIVGRFIEQIHQEDGEQAGIGALAFSLGQQELPQNSDQLTGAIRALLHRTGRDGASAESERTALADLRDRFRRSIKLTEQETQQIRQERGESAAKHEKWLEEQHSQFEIWRAKQEELRRENNKAHDDRRSSELARFKNERDGAIAELQAHIRAVKEEMKLRAPVEYWKTKASGHKTAATGFAVSSGIAAVSSLIVIGVAAAYFLTGFSGGDSSTYWRIGALATLVFVLLWGLRILVRLLLSHLHLLTDANERVALVQCYLALAAEGKIDDKDRALVLAPLFASTADGLVKDDGAPPSILDVINKLIDKK